MLRAESLDDMQKEIQRGLSSVFPDFNISSDFVKQQFYGIVDQPFLTVSLLKITSHSESYADYWGVSIQEDGNTEIYGHLAEATFRFQFGIPITAACLTSNTLFLQLCNYILSQPEYDFSEISCEELEFHQAMQCFVLTANAKTQILLTKQDIYQPIRDIVVEPVK